MKKARQLQNEIPKNFKPKVKWIKRAQMWTLITAKDGKIVQEWFAKDNRPTL